MEVRKKLNKIIEINGFLHSGEVRRGGCQIRRKNCPKGALYLMLLANTKSPRFSFYFCGASVLPLLCFLLPRSAAKLPEKISAANIFGRILLFPRGGKISPPILQFQFFVLFDNRLKLYWINHNFNTIQTYNNERIRRKNNNPRRKACGTIKPCHSLHRRRRHRPRYLESRRARIRRGRREGL